MPTAKTVPAMPEGHPDAVIMPQGWRSPETSWKATLLDHQCTALEEILGGSHPERTAWLTPIPGSRFLATLDPLPSEHFPTGHPLEKQPRYDWYPQDNGLSYGFLRPDPLDEHPQA